jgi:hypothetical protein
VSSGNEGTESEINAMEKRMASSRRVNTIYPKFADASGTFSATAAPSPNTSDAASLGGISNILSVSVQGAVSVLT